MHVVKVISRQKDREYVSYLLRQSYREGGQVKKRTVANLSALPVHIIDAIRRGLAGDPLLPHEPFHIRQSWPHGHVAAVLGTARKMGLEALIDPAASRQRDVVLAMVVARVLHPASKLATTRLWTATSLARTLGVEQATEEDLYGAMDWLLERQQAIEQRLAKRHLKPGGLVLYDLSSSYLEGEHCPLAKRGHSRDGKPGQLQIEFGLLTSGDGTPVAIEVFPGNAADPSTFAAQVTKVQQRFGVDEVVWVGDRGMITGAQVRQLDEVAGLSWVTALRAPTIDKLLEAGSIQMSLFDTQNLAEVSDDRFPGERLVVCHNPLLQEKRARKREDMLLATERELAHVVAMVQRGEAGGRGGLRGAAAIGERVGRVVNKYAMAKHFERTITDSSFSYKRKQDAIDQEAKLDGLYVLRTNVPGERLSAREVVLAYKSLGQVESAFRHFKLSELEVRPIYHRLEDRVRAHLLLCMLAYSVQRTMEQALAPLLFKDAALPERADPVAPAQRSAQALRKGQTKLTADGFPVHSFRTLLAQLAAQVKNQIVFPGKDTPLVEMTTRPTPLHARAFELLGLLTTGL